MAILDLGLSATLSRELARVDNSHQTKIKLLQTLEALLISIILVSICGVFCFSNSIVNSWLNIENYELKRISIFIKIISFDIGFQLLLRFYMGGLFGLEKQVKANLYQVSWGIARNAFVVLAILVIPTLEVFFIWQSLSTIIFAYLVGRSLKKALRVQNFFHFKIDKSVLKMNWRFSCGMLLIALVASLNTQMDKLMISSLLSLESLGHYTLAISIATGILVFVSPISLAVLPRFTALYSAEKKDEASRLFEKISLIVAIVVFSIMVNISFFAKEILWVWTGEIELAERAHIYLPFTAFSAAMLSLGVIPFNIAIANGYTKLNNQIGLLSLGITIPGYWLATKSFGVIGAAAVFCVVQTSTTLIYIYFINRKFVKENNVKKLYFEQMLFPLVISMAISFCFTYAPEYVENTRVGYFLWITLATSVTFCITISILLPVRELKQFGVRQMNQFLKDERD